MKDILLPFIPLSGLLADASPDATFWERIAEKWGIGFVGLALFVVLARFTMKRDDEREKKRDERDELEKAEKVALAKENNRLQQELLDQHRNHSRRLEALIKDGNKHQADVGQELKNLARRVRCPGTTPNADGTTYPVASLQSKE